MNTALLQQHLNAPVCRTELTERYCSGKSVLDLGFVNHNVQNTQQAGWLHEKIRRVAAHCVGVDYLQAEVAALKARGYNVLCADITQPFDPGETYDVIVIGNLIEHLSNFEGLFKNVAKLLKPQGCLLVTTPNPFFDAQYFYSAFKNDIMVNPEHTCWIDPVVLDQLAVRFGLETRDVFWIKEKWWLGQVILHGRRWRFDMLSGNWACLSPSLLERVCAPVLSGVTGLCFPRRFANLKKRVGDAAGRYLYIRVMGVIFETYWRIYRCFIVRSALNRYELYTSILIRSAAPAAVPQVQHA